MGFGRARIALAVALLLSQPAAIPAAAESATLTIVVEGLRSTRGLLRYWVYDRAETFIQPDGELRTGAVRITESVERIRVPDLPFGDYAVAVGHDEDEDGEIAKVIGAESRGVSNYTSALRWYPSFERAKFPVRTADVEIVVRVF